MGGYFRKAIADDSLQRIQRFITQHNKVHSRSRVVLFIEGNQICSHRIFCRIFKGLQVPDRKLRERMLRICQLAQHIPLPPGIILKLELILGIYCVTLPVDIFLVEQRIDEKAGETVQGLHQVDRIYVKEVVRLLQARVGIKRSAMFRQKCLVLAGLGKFIRPKEQHVFKEMCQAFPVCRILKAADVDTE